MKLFLLTVCVLLSAYSANGAGVVEVYDVVLNPGDVVIDGEVYEAVRDRRLINRRLIKYGFRYKGSASALEEEYVQSMEEGLCTCRDGRFVGKQLDLEEGKVCDVAHLSSFYECTGSVSLVQGFIGQYNKKGGLCCMSMEDAVFIRTTPLLYDCLFSVGMHPACPCLRPRCGEFDRCFELHVTDQPILFFSSGRDNFRGAGQFLYELRHHRVWDTRPCVSFLFLAIQLQGKDCIDVRQEVALSASQAGFRAEEEESVDHWLEVWDACVDYAVCRTIYPGKVVFSQDERNVLTTCKPPRVIPQLFTVSKADVLLEEHIDLNTKVLLSSYMLFERLRQTADVGCVDFDRMTTVSDRSQHTLVCARTQYTGPPILSVDGEHRDFAGSIMSDDFCQNFAKRWGYKEVVCVTCDSEEVQDGYALVCGGSFEPDPPDDTFEVLFSCYPATLLTCYGCVAIQKACLTR